MMISDDEYNMNTEESDEGSDYEGDEGYTSDVESESGWPIGRYWLCGENDLEEQHYELGEWKP